MTSDAPRKIVSEPDSAAARIEVFYPAPDPIAFSTSDIDALRRLEPVIVRNAHSFFLSDSNYRWEAEKENGNAAHVRLMQTRLEVQVLALPLDFLRRCSIEEFHEILRKA